MSSLTLPARKLLSSMEVAFIDKGLTRFETPFFDPALFSYLVTALMELLDEGFIEFVYVEDGEDYYRFTEDHMNSLLQEQLCKP